MITYKQQFIFNLQFKVHYSSNSKPEVALPLSVTNSPWHTVVTQHWQIYLQPF